VQLASPPVPLVWLLAQVSEALQRQEVSLPHLLISEMEHERWAAYQESLSLSFRIEPNLRM
jgi:hypothetical protein